MLGEYSFIKRSPAGSFEKVPNFPLLERGQGGFLLLWRQEGITEGIKGVCLLLKVRGGYIFVVLKGIS